MIAEPVAYPSRGARAITAWAERRRAFQILTEGCPAARPTSRPSICTTSRLAASSSAAVGAGWILARAYAPVRPLLFVMGNPMVSDAGCRQYGMLSKTPRFATRPAFRHSGPFFRLLNSDVSSALRYDHFNFRLPARERRRTHLVRRDPCRCVGVLVRAIALAAAAGKRDTRHEFAGANFAVWPLHRAAPRRSIGSCRVRRAL